MNYDECYFDDDLRIYYFNFNETDKFKMPNRSKKSKYESYYRILWLAGEFMISIDKNIYHYSDPIICISSPDVSMNVIPKKAPYEFIAIEIHPKVCASIPQSDEVLNFFYKLHGEQRIFNLTQPRNSNLNVMIELLKSRLFAKSGRFHIETRVNAIISELCMIYESEYTEYVASTDSVPTQIIDYIRKHYMCDITLDMISEKFFVSKPTIIAIVKRFTGMSFKKYVTRLRLESAVKMFETGDQTALKISSLCGFSDYSSFYRAFKDFYGCTPKEKFKKTGSSFPLK